MLTSRNLFIALMAVAGLILGGLVLRQPAIAAGTIPPVMWLLVVSFVVDLVIMQLGRNAGFQPLDTITRFIGFCVATLIYLAVTLLLAPAPAIAS